MLQVADIMSWNVNASAVVDKLEEHCIRGTIETFLQQV